MSEEYLYDKVGAANDVFKIACLCIDHVMEEQSNKPSPDLPSVDELLIARAIMCFGNSVTGNLMDTKGEAITYEDFFDELESQMRENEGD